MSISILLNHRIKIKHWDHNTTRPDILIFASEYRLSSCAVICNIQIKNLHLEESYKWIVFQILKKLFSKISSEILLSLVLLKIQLYKAGEYWS